MSYPRFGFGCEYPNDAVPDFAGDHPWPPPTILRFSGRGECAAHSLLLGNLGRAIMACACERLSGPNNQRITTRHSRDPSGKTSPLFENEHAPSPTRTAATRSRVFSTPVMALACAPVPMILWGQYMKPAFHKNTRDRAGDSTIAIEVAPS